MRRQIERLRYGSVTAINVYTSGVERLRRSYSDPNVNTISESDDNVAAAAAAVSTLELNTGRVNVGERITLSWNLAIIPTENDRLILSYQDDPLSESYIDTKVKTGGKSKVGQISWLIRKETQLKEDINLCVFKYFHGLVTEQQRCIATTPAFTVCRPLSMCPTGATPPMAIPGVDDLLNVYISGAKASNLKKGFFGKPKPSMVINIVPRVRHLAAFQKHHGQQGKACSQNNTVDPLWEDKKFEFTATAADLLEIVVRNKSKARAPVKKFLGKLVFPISKIIESCGLDTARRITQHLLGRTTADKVQGTFSFTICIRKSLQKAEYTFPRLSKRITQNESYNDSTLPLPNAQHTSILNANGVVNINFTDPKTSTNNTDKQRPHSYHPHSLLERSPSDQGPTVNGSSKYTVDGHFPFRRSESVPEEVAEEEEEEEDEDAVVVVDGDELVNGVLPNGQEDEDDEEEDENSGSCVDEEPPEHQYFEVVEEGEECASSSCNDPQSDDSEDDNTIDNDQTMTSLQTPVHQEQLGRTSSAPKISYEKIANSRFYVKRQDERQDSSPPTQTVAISSLLNTAFCTPTTTQVADLQHLQPERHMDVIEVDIQDSDVAESSDTVRNGHSENVQCNRQRVSEPLDMEANDGNEDDDDGYVEVEPEFTHENEAGSCDSSELEENSNDNTSTTVSMFRVNSCQHLLPENAEFSDGDSSSTTTNLISSTDTIPTPCVTDTDTNTIITDRDSRTTAAVIGPKDVPLDSLTSVNTDETYVSSTHTSIDRPRSAICLNLVTNRDTNLIDLRSPVTAAMNCMAVESAPSLDTPISSCNSSGSSSNSISNTKTTSFFGNAGFNLDTPTKVSLGGLTSSDILDLTSVTCSATNRSDVACATCLACTRSVPAKTVASYPGGARPREPKSASSPRASELFNEKPDKWSVTQLSTPTTSTKHTNGFDIASPSMPPTKYINDFDRTSSHILTSEKNMHLSSNNEFNNANSQASATASNKVSNTTKNGDLFYVSSSSLSNTSELSESIFTMPLFTSSDIRLPPPRNENLMPTSLGVTTSLGGIINSSFTTSPRPSSASNSKDMPLAQTDFDISSDHLSSHSNNSNKQSLVNIIKNEFPPFTVTSTPMAGSSGGADVIDTVPKMDRMNSLNEMLTYTTTGVSSTSQTPLTRDTHRRSMHKKKNRTTSQISGTMSTVISSIASVSESARIPPMHDIRSPMPEVPPPLPPKEGSPRNVPDGSESHSSSPHVSKQAGVLEGFRSRTNRSSQPTDIINEVIRKGETRGRESVRRSRVNSSTSSSSAGTSTASTTATGRVPGAGEERLPKNWERAVDSHGRVYYIDHNSKTTTWHRPSHGTPTSPEHTLNTQLEQLDRRYQSLRRTLRAGRRTAQLAEHTIPENAIVSESTSTAPVPVSTSSTSTNSPNLSAASPSTSSLGAAASSQNWTFSAEERSRAVTESPGCLFLLRRDFFQFVSNHNLASQFLHRNPSLNKIVSKVRSDPQQFARYQHSRDVVTLLNFFASDTIPLPPGWEVKNDGYGQSYYVDHNVRSTTFIDPRLPLEETSSRSSRHRDQPHATTPTISTPSTHSSDAALQLSQSQQQQQQQQQQPQPQQSTSTSTRRSRRGPHSTPPPPTYATSSSTSVTTSSSSRPEATTATVDVPKTYDEKVVAFLRQDNVTEILKRRDNDYDGKTALQRKISLIQRDGVNGLKRYQSDMELVILVSMFEDEIQTYVPKAPSLDSTTLSISRTFSKGSMRVTQSGRTSAPYRRDFEAKIRTFHKQLIHNEYGQGPGKIRLKIRRRHVLQEAFDQIMKQSPRSLHKEKLYIKFTGEEGLDYGGPAREFFFMISRELFNPYYGLFEYSAIDTYTLQVSPASRYVENAHNWFRFAGRIIALSLIHQHLLDVFFTRTIYKALLQEPYDLSDVQSLDQVLHQSLTWILENDITDVLELCFTVSEEVFGDEKVQERELKSNGSNIPVTEENKKEYVDLMVKWKIERGMGEQMEQIIKGFGEALDLKMISIFDDRELELVLAGTADIDIKDWRKNTEYRSGYHDKHKVVQWFWKAVDSFTNERRLRLIQFVTGTSSIPYEGFGALRGSTGLKKFTIDCWGSAEMLPRAHTCFNRLDLPPYEEYATLLDKILYAIEETSTFGIE